MLILESRFSPSELAERWDDRTSPARFAGNDDVMDDIYIARRKDNRVFLIRKGGGTWDPFATVFRGKIEASDTGSVLKGSFSKRVLDYIVFMLFLFLDIYFAYRGYLMDAWSFSTVLVCSAVLVVLLLLIIPLPPARRRYTAFIREITDNGL